MPDDSGLMYRRLEWSAVAVNSNHNNRQSIGLRRVWCDVRMCCSDWRTCIGYKVSRWCRISSTSCVSHWRYKLPSICVSIINKHECTVDQELAYAAADASFSFTRWQHFEVHCRCCRTDISMFAGTESYKRHLPKNNKSSRHQQNKNSSYCHPEAAHTYVQESLSDAKVSARQRCVLFARYWRLKLENRLFSSTRSSKVIDRGANKRCICNFQ